MVSDSKYQALRSAVGLIKVPCFLVCGTLLGAIRQQSLIAWDHDVDLGIWDTHRQQLPQGLPIIRTVGSDTAGWEYTLQINGVPVDLFFFHTNKDHCWFNVGGIWIYRYPLIQQTIPIKLDSLWLRVPYNYEACLEANYGTDWKKPNKNWSWQNAPCCYPAMPSAV